MKNLTDKIQESILDNDSKVTKDAMKQVAREWVYICCKSGQNKLEEGEDYSIDDEGHISVFGDCTFIEITSRSPILKKLNSSVKIARLEPDSSYCRIIVRDPEAAASILPLSQIGNGSDRRKFVIIYDTKEDLEPRHFPMLVHGDIEISRAKSVNLCIMPNCTGTLTIRENECNKIKYPAGFPSSARQITIHR